MQSTDPTRSLVGHVIWQVAEWVEAHYDGDPYELFRFAPDQDDLPEDQRYGYRLTVQRIPRPER